MPLSARIYECKKTLIRFDEARAFLAEEALPFWSLLGVYPNGCFVERFDLAGNPVDPGFTRVRVQARQIYVYCHAHVAGLFALPQCFERAFDFFIRSAWLGADRGWARLITRDGALLNGSSDLYDISFALLALAWRHRVAPDPQCLKIAHATLDFLDAHMKHPLGGYDNDADRSLPRCQNPHMHLAEAMNAWFEASGERRFLKVAERLIDLLEFCFCNPVNGALGEFYNDNWTPVADSRGDFVEPGHQFEWAWIIGQYGRLSGAARLHIMQRLIDSALRHGFDEATGLTIDKVDRDGRIIAGSRRLWPQTEALKASLAAAEFLNQPAQDRIGRIVGSIFDRFLRPGPVPGTWIDHYDSGWSPIVNQIPATSLYHITLAFLELLRLRDVLNDGPSTPIVGA
jgi:mannose/cellobiose epimerase-like protein (N-acyl-D-glucosamine 2-epimerase family)